MNSPSNLPFRCTRRRYSAQPARHAMLCARVHDGAKRAVTFLAKERGMTTSEYIARLVNDHLTQVTRSRGQLPAIEETH